MKLRTAEDVIDAKNDLDISIKEFLLSRGWEYTSRTPDSRWRYRKEFGFEVFWMDQDDAIDMEFYLQQGTLIE